MNSKYLLNKSVTRYIPLCFLVLAVSFLFSCSKMDGTYKDFIKSGEIIFTGRVDSLKALPGKNRMQLTWLLVSDPKITKNVVYWNDKADSMVLNVTKTAKTDTISTTIAGLTEKTYTFQVYTYDNYGHSSVKSEVIGTVYGDNYISTLLNRPLNSTVYTTTTKNLAITWYGVSAQAISVEMKYTDNSGATKTVKDVLVQDPTTPHPRLILLPVSNLPDFKKGTSFTYRTAYKPVSSCIDTFYTDWTSVLVP